MNTNAPDKYEPSAANESYALHEELWRAIQTANLPAKSTCKSTFAFFFFERYQTQ
jgi:hypothetical protein